MPGLPVQADAGMRTGIDIAVDAVAAADDENVPLPAIELDAEAATARIGEIIEMTEYRALH